MRCVLVRLDIGNEDQTSAHGILSVLSNVHWSLDGVSQLQLVGFDGNNLQERHLFNELLGFLVVEAILLRVVTGSFQEKTADVATELQLLLDGCRVLLLGDDCVHDRLIKRPSLGATSGLNQSSEVGLGSSETTQPHDLGLFNFIPVFVLLIPGLEVLHPGYKSLKGSGCLSFPLIRHETIEETVTECFESFTHSDNTSKRLL